MTPLSAPTASGGATASLGTRAGPAPESGGFAAILGGAQAGQEAIGGHATAGDPQAGAGAVSGIGGGIGGGKPTGKDLPVLPAKAAARGTANDDTLAPGEEPGARESGAVQDTLRPEPLPSDPVATDPTPLAAVIAALALVPNLAATDASTAPQGNDTGAGAGAISPSPESRPVPALAVPSLPAAVPAGTPSLNNPALAPATRESASATGEPASATGRPAPVEPKDVALAAIALVPIDAAADDPAAAHPAMGKPTAPPDVPDEAALPADKAPVAAGSPGMNARIVPALRPLPLAGQASGSIGASASADRAPASLSLAADPAAPAAGDAGTPALAPPPDFGARVAEARRSAANPSGDPLADQPALPAAPVTLAHSAPDTIAIGASGSSAAAPPTSVFTPPAGGTGETAQGPQDFATLVSKLGEAREAASPHLVRTAITHGEFGPVSLQFRHEGGALSVTMANADPAFASAVQTGLAATLASGAGNGAQADGNGDGARGEARQAWQQASASHAGPGATGSFGADSRQNQDRAAAQPGARDEERARQGSAAPLVQASGEASGSTQPPAAGPGRSGIYA